MQLPPLQTSPLPHEVPSVTLVNVVGLVEGWHDWQGFVGLGSPGV
jgi:hypothetical protein